eukprot:4793782-Lingulodinium_polyedra.AAC.1
MPSCLLHDWIARHGAHAGRVSPLDAARWLVTYGCQARAARRACIPRSMRGPGAQRDRPGR